MASPFRLFRKYQKAFLVVAGVLAIFIFVVGDAMMGCVGQAGGGRRSPDVVVTSWEGGSLTVQEMDMLYQRRLFISDCLSNLYQEGKYRVESGGGTPIPPRVPTFFLNANVKPEAVMALCVEERIFADQAREIGMAVSDDMINHFLRETGFRRIGDLDIRNILQGMRRFDLRTSEELLFAGLRELILGNLYTTSISGSVMSVPPEQRWKDWLMLNNRIALEAAVLPIETFISEVPEPIEGQLIFFYEQHKNRVSGNIVRMGGIELPSPNPGFREPRRVKLNYLLGDVTVWTQEMLSSVTDEEIADYYERNQRTQFVKLASDTETAVTEEATSEQDEGEEASAEGEEASAEGEEASAEGEDATEDSAEGETSSEAPADANDDEASGDDEDVEYVPLEEVSDEIRRLLANDKAVLELKRLMESAFGDLTTVYNRYGYEVIEARSEERDPPPAPPRLADLSAMAKEKKLISEETVLLSARDMSETMVGKAVDAQTRQRVVTQAAFTDLRFYEPLLAQDLDGYWYLVVKVADQPSRVPELEEVHDQVVAAWKRNEAANLALEKGGTLAEEVQESGKSLEAFFIDSGYEVTITDLFS
ncbi:MAG: hypothetical protein IH831_07345, partial [Planctomycetes bacterium]|nr:hypothetical protein [Planctomycetota bacterium]